MKNFFSYLLAISLLFCCCTLQENAAILDLASGTLERTKEFPSKFIKPRNIDVWLPESYSDQNRYAVLYMHDGQMLFDSSKTWNGQEWGVDETVASLLEKQEIRNTIVVGIWNTDLRHSEYFPQKPFENLPTTTRDSILNLGRSQNASLFKTAICSDGYLKFIVEELKPFIDEKYSTLPDFQNTFIAGSSMGGLISMYALCEYPNVFSGAACISAHWIGTFDTLNNPIPPLFMQYLEGYLPVPKAHKIYFDYGTATLDQYYEPYQMMVDSIMMRKGYGSKDWQTIKFEGENHSEKSWSKRLDIPLKFLLEKVNR